MMMPPIIELSLIGVADAGVPNRERIILRPTQPVNLAQFGIFVGIHNATNNMTTLLPDQFFWFNERVVEPPSWLVVYTGIGEAKETRIPSTNEKAYSFHWGRENTFFDIPALVPVVARIGSILVGKV